MPESPISYRPMTVADIDATTYVRKAALEGLDRSQGRDVWPWSPDRLPHFEHLLRTDPDGAWVAVIGGTVVAYAMGFTRGEIWFLAQLFVQPEVHARGAGHELLRLAMDAGRKRGARVFSVVSSTSPVAQSLYMRAGMMATAIGYRLSGPVEALLALPEPQGARKLTIECDGWQQRLADLDRLAFGASRQPDHELYLGDAWGEDGGPGLMLDRDGVAIGYGYAMKNGHIGPFAARAPEDQLQLLRMAGDWLAEHNVEKGYGYFLTSNRTVMGALLNGGWRIEGWTFFLTTEPYGRFDRYVPGGGLLL